MMGMTKRQTQCLEVVSEPGFRLRKRYDERTLVERNRGLKLIFVLVMTLLPTLNVAATSADDLDEQLLKSLEEETSQDSLPVVVARILDNTDRASTRLSEQVVDERTQKMQQQILDDIDALLKQSSPPPSSPPPSSNDGHPQTSETQNKPSSQGESATGEGDPMPEAGDDSANDPNARSRESTERTAQADGQVSDQERRLGLASAVWGHLPPKVREQMRSAFSETYLPEYDDLVRRYYEALAARRDRQDRGDSD